MTRKHLLAWLAAAPLASASFAVAADQPNILWIIAEDACKDFGCYGAEGARTPNIDKLAAESCRYNHAFATAPVCSASRSAFMTGLYQIRIGAQNHRSHRAPESARPEGVRLITERLREAGYFTANIRELPPGLGFKGAAKTDWNFFDDGKGFDSAKWSDVTTHAPFFAQINLHETHRIYYRAASGGADPASVKLPPYLADDPLIREDWAAYLDEIAVLDGKVGQLLKLLDNEGMRENTVVFFFSDHGREDFRGKYFPYEQGFEVPLIVRWPKLLKPGAVSDALVSLLDVHATTLALAGVGVDGLDGWPFFGPGARPRDYVFGARDRIDDTLDRVRTVRDARFKYLRNYEPQRPYLQRMAYAEISNPTYNRMRQLSADGRLNGDQAKFMATHRPVEELYDLQTDPFELHNLASDTAQSGVLERLRGKVDAWVAETHDSGTAPEDARVVAEELKRNEDAAARLRKSLGLGPDEVLLKVPMRNANNRQP